jgi:cobalt-precorrin-5B (C1)-methyltransferase
MTGDFDESASIHALRKGWTTGACAAGASAAAYEALLTNRFPHSVTLTLPQGQRPCFELALTELGDDYARAGIIKDAGDDPDVTHGAMIIATVRHGAAGTGIEFMAGQGVGTVTRPGLPLPPGEPAINPGPRVMIKAAIETVAQNHNGCGDVVIELSIPDGEKIAERTLNGRLGIVGGLSILGTTGVVVPYSCSAWIHSIHRGIDVARAAGLDHIAAATGATSEAAVKWLHGLPDMALIEMGDFVGGMLKYLRKHPVAKVTIAGGLAKMTKLGQGMLDLHSKRGHVDLAWLAAKAKEAGCSAELCAAIVVANAAKEAFELGAAARIDLASPVAKAAWQTAAKVLRGGPIILDIVIFDRDGSLLARAGGESAYQAKTQDSCT